MKKAPDTTHEPHEIRAPSYFSRPEKRQFLAAISQLSAGNEPPSAAEIDVLADYVAARSRIATLHRLWRRTVRQDYRTAADVAALARQIDSATAACRRLAKALAMPSGKREPRGGNQKSKLLAATLIANGAAGQSPSGREAAR